MTDIQKKSTVKALVCNDSAATDEVVAVYLSVASDKMLKRRYPFGADERKLTPDYDMLQCQLAARLLLRRGAEGEISHNENGVNISYDSVDDYDLLCQIVPVAEVR